MLKVYVEILTKQKIILGWTPKTSFKKLVQLMVQEDLEKTSK